MNWKFWKKKAVKLEPFDTNPIDTNKITIFCRYPEAEEFIRLLKRDRDNIARLEMLDMSCDKTWLRKGESLAYTQIIANMIEVRKEEKIYARRSSNSE
jgi:hypothetical protein